MCGERVLYLDIPTKRVNLVFFIKDLISFVHFNVYSLLIFVTYELKILFNFRLKKSNCNYIL